MTPGATSLLPRKEHIDMASIWKPDNQFFIPWLHHGWPVPVHGAAKVKQTRRVETDGSEIGNRARSFTFTCIFTFCSDGGAGVIIMVDAFLIVIILLILYDTAKIIFFFSLFLLCFTLLYYKQRLLHLYDDGGDCYFLRTCEISVKAIW